MPLGRIDGVRAGTTLAWVDQEQAGHGTPVTVVLSQRARVDAFRGSQLLSTSYLDAGMQSIDTRMFPVGSYPVTLRVIENGRETRSETVAFSRSGGEGLGSDQWQWFAQGGRVVDVPGDAKSRDVAQFGVRLPTMRGASLSNATTVFDSRRAYNETRLDWHVLTGLGAWTISAGALIGSDGTRGDLQQLSIGRTVAWNLYRQAMRAKDCRVVEDWPAPRGCHSSLTSTISLPLAGGSLTAGYTYGGADQFAAPWHDPLSPHLDYGVSRQRNEGYDATFARAFSVQGGFVSLRMGAYRREAGNVTDDGVHASVSFSRHRNASQATRASVHQTASVDARTSRNGDDGAQLRGSQTHRWEGATRREVTVSAAADTDSLWEAGIDGRIDGRYGTAGATAFHYDTQMGSSVAWTANHTGSFAVSRNGAFLGAGAPGGNPGAGVVVHVNNSSRAYPKGSVAAKVAGASSGDVQLGFGESMLVPMEGYTAARTHVADGDGSRQSLGTVVSGAGRRDWFLQPGKLGVQQIEATLTMTYVGRLVDAREQPLSHVLLLESPTGQTGEDGSFIAEFDGHPARIFALDPLQLHVCDVAAPDAVAAVQRLGTTRCRVGSVDELPLELRDGERFKRWALRRVANLQANIEQGEP
nr:TcfC E-set like domain-containing protein [Lysobacter gilvus]